VAADVMCQTVNNDSEKVCQLPLEPMIDSLLIVTN